ncbi:MAG: hypothetical protein QOF96_3450 [Actinomycetota bacterium]|jgi:hypothetical protein|nr:hypothetical protein [Actinomycetota bacterium]
MAEAAEVSWEPDGRLPAPAPGVDLAGLRALALGVAQSRRRAVADLALAVDDDAPAQAGPKAPRVLLEPLASWC